MTKMVKKILIKTTPLAEECDKKSVEKRLKEISFKLTETESNIKLFLKMIRTGVATNDVRSFLQKQTGMKRSTKRIDKKTLKSSMKSKLQDALVYARALRQDANKLRKKVMVKHNENKSQGRSILRSIRRKAAVHRQVWDRKNNLKYKLCREKIRLMGGTEWRPRGSIDSPEQDESI